MPEKPEDKLLYVPRGSSKAEIEIKNSRFISRCFYAPAEKDAGKIISEIKSSDRGAAHVVYAFVCGADKNLSAGMSDDGEPRGTAGKPVLQVLKGSGVTDVLCTVTRYFGGTKLGTGGLVKAYTEAAKEALQKLETVKLVRECEISFTLSYEHYDSVRYYLKNLENTTIISEVFESCVSVLVKIPDAGKQEIFNRIKEITSGRIEYHKSEASPFR